MGCAYIDTCSTILLRESNTYNFKKFACRIDGRQARVNVNATHAKKKGIFENSNRILLNLQQLYIYPDTAVLYHCLEENYLSVPIDLVRF
jgi:hypothetical protein